MDIVLGVMPIAILFVIGVIGWMWYSERKETKQRRYQEYLDSRVKPYKPRD